MSAISLGASDFPLGGMRTSGSAEEMRFRSSLAALLPGRATRDLRRSSRVSIDSDALYLPLVWHSAQRVLRMGRMSWAKSILGSPEAARRKDATRLANAMKDIPRRLRLSKACQAASGKGYLMNNISRYVGSGQRSSATTVSSLSPSVRTLTIAG